MAKRPKQNVSGKRRTKSVPAEEPIGGAVLEEIYGNDETATEEPKHSLRHIEQKKDSRVTKILLWTIVVMVLVVGAATAGFFVFNQERHFNERGVVINVEAGDVPSGGDAKLVFTIKNNEVVGIKAMQLSLSAPDGWTFKDSNPKPDDEHGTVWSLGSLGAGQSATFTVSGTIVGEVGSIKTLSATLRYRPSNFNYDFSSKVSGTVTISSSILTLDLQGPSQSNPNATATYVLSYTNSSDRVIEGLRFTASYPEGFTVGTQKPKPQNGNSVWTVDSLANGAKGTIEITGTFGSQTGSLQLLFVADIKKGNEYEKQVESSVVILINSSTLSLEVTANKVKENSTATAGDVVSYVVTYKNASDAELTNVAISAVFSGGAFDAPSFSDDDGAKLNNGKATWDTKLIPQLASLKPKATGTIRFSLKIPVKPAVTKGAGGSTISAEFSAAVEGNQVVTTSPVVTKILTTVSLDVDPRYYRDEGTQVGSGPLPPTVGQTTSYRVYWRMSNTSNDVTSITVKASVPNDTFWTGKNVSTTAGSIAFDAATRTITWTLNKLPAGVGVGSTPVSAGFELSVTPNSGNVGSTMKLLEEQTLSGTDGFSGTTLTVKHDSITTDLAKDTRAAGKGTVVSS